MNYEFETYDPVLTFTGPGGPAEPEPEHFRNFVDSAGKFITGTGIHDADFWTLWGIGRHAYMLLAIADESDFSTRISRYRSAMEDIRSTCIESLKAPQSDDFESRPVDADYFGVLSGFSLLDEDFFGWDYAPEDFSRGEELVEYCLFACLEAIDSAIQAIQWGEKYAVSYAIDASTALNNALTFRPGEETHRRVRGEMARHAARERHRHDPKQVDKKFVFSCYQEWRAAPSRYESKAAFARDMLDKCTHLVSQKKIEDWVRGWDKKLQSIK